MDQLNAMTRGGLIRKEAYGRGAADRDFLLAIVWTGVLIVGGTLASFPLFPLPLPCFMATDQASGCGAN